MMKKREKKTSVALLFEFETRTCTEMKRKCEEFITKIQKWLVLQPRYSNLVQKRGVFVDMAFSSPIRLPSPLLPFFPMLAQRRNVIKTNRLIGRKVKILGQGKGGKERRGEEKDKKFLRIIYKIWWT